MTRRIGLLLAFLFVVLAAVFAVREVLLLQQEADPDVPEGAQGNDPERGGDTPRLEGVGREDESAGPAHTAMVDLAAVDRDRDVHGRLLGPDGTPVRAAFVEAVVYPWRRRPVHGDPAWMDLTIQGPTTQAGADGAFALRLRRGDVVSLRIRAPGWVPFEVPNLGAGERADIELRRPVTFIVHLRDGADRPVADGTATLQRSWVGGAPTFLVTVAADAEGRCVFRELPGGLDASLDVESRRLGAVPWQEITLPDEGEASLDVVFTDAEAMTGHVTDRVSGSPIEAAVVGVSSLRRGAVRTDAGGRYVLPGYFRGDAQQLYVVAEGYVPMGDVLPGAAPTDFQLVPGVTVKGRIVDTQKRPVEGAQVAIAGRKQEGRWRSLESHGLATTNAQGRFEMDGMLSGLEHSVTVLARGHGRLEQALLVEASAEGACDVGRFVLPPGRVVAGRLLRADGEGVARHPVTLLGPGAQDASPASMRRGRLDSRVTDDLGRFLFTDLAPGRYVLTSLASGGRRPQLALDVPEDRDLEDVEMFLEERDTWRVVVVGSDGGPVEGVTVAFRGIGTNAGSVRAETDEHGVASVELVEPPTFVGVRVGESLALRYLSLPSRPWPTGLHEVSIRLPRALAILGRVLLPDGKPYGGAEMNFRRGYEILEATWTEHDGTFAVPFRSADPVDVEVTGGELVGESYVRRPLEGRVAGVVPGEGELEIKTRRLDSDRSLTVVVLDPEGHPLRGASVDVQPGVPGAVMPRRTGADGRVRIEGLDPRPVSVLVEPPADHEEDWAARRSPSVVAEGQALTLQFTAGVLLTGRVTGPEGRPVEGCTVRTVKLGVYVRAVTDAEGAFRLYVDPQHLPITLAATHSPSRKTHWTGRAESVDADQAPITLRIGP